MNFIKNCHFKITSRIFNSEVASSPNVSHVRFLSDDKKSCDDSNDEKLNTDAVCTKDCKETEISCETETKSDCDEKKTNPCENTEKITDPAELERLKRGLEYLKTPIPGMLSDVTSRGHDYTSDECYQAPEYYMYHKYSFYDAHDHLSSKRLPQPMRPENVRTQEKN